MKKFLSVLALFLVAIAGNVSAQTSGSGGGQGKAVFQDIHLTSIKLNEGLNAVPVRASDGNSGTLRFLKRGNTFSNVLFVDATGKVARLSPNDDAPNPVCKCPLPDACFATEDKNIGMCICKACDLTMPDVIYNIGLLLPAVQKVREAAARN